MKIAVFGANGQLGRELQAISASFSPHQLYFTDIDDIDITNEHRLKAYLFDNQIDIIINTAAYTAVDKAEEELIRAWQINALAVERMAFFAKEKDIFLIHISTDYVIEGQSYRPYNEEDRTAPISVYGRSKRAAEEAILCHKPRSVIIRTAWLYSSYGYNFVKTILRLAKQNSQIEIVCDQIGTPTYAADLAHIISLFVNKIDMFKEPQIFHFSNEGVASWYDFAYEIVQQSHLQCVVKPIPTTSYPTLATRPFYSVLDKQKVKTTLNISIPHWRESLEKCLRGIDF